MTRDEQQQQEQLVAIGSELDDLYFSGRLDFDTFKSLLNRAIAAVGPDHEGLEMFCHFARGEAGGTGW